MKQRCRPVSFLASVTSEVEAQTCVALGADIIDAKDPATGALGALPGATVRRICQRISARVPVSATIGDLPAIPELVVDAVRDTAATGVDIVKIGFWPGGDTQATLQKLSNLAIGPVRLVGVLLADRGADIALIRAMAEVGFAGVMLDTSEKTSGALPDIVRASTLVEFIEMAHANGMFAGLAGSLRVHHVPELLSLGADLLGFRGGLCRDGQRSDGIEEDAVRRVRSAIPLTELMSAQPCSSAGYSGIAPTQPEQTV